MTFIHEMNHIRKIINYAVIIVGNKWRKKQTQEEVYVSKTEKMSTFFKERVNTYIIVKHITSIEKKGNIL